jgi:twitching motility protein PilI
MQTESINNAPAQSDWLSPTEALTRQPASTAILSPVGEWTHTQETVWGFKVGSLGFLVAAGMFCEVIENLHVNPLPNVKPWLNGLLNLRGNLVPVIDLALLFGEERGENKRRRLFAIDRGEKTVALWIDNLPETQAAFTKPLAQLPPLPLVLQPYVGYAYLRDGQIWLDIQFYELFKALGRQYAN